PVVRPERGDRERALGVRLTADVGEVEVVRGGRLGRGACGRGDRRHVVTAQQPHGVVQGWGGEYPEAVDRERFGVVHRWHDERTNALTPAGESYREHAADTADLPVQRQLSDDRDPADAVDLERAGRREDAERDGEIERGAFLANVRGSQVHRDAIAREREAGVANRRADPLAALADRRV